MQSSAENTSSDILQKYSVQPSDELMAFVTREAERDADAVTQLISSYRSKAGCAIALSREHLLSLGLLVRLRRWSAFSVPFMINDSVSAGALLAQILVDLPSGSISVPTLIQIASRIVVLATRRFAWQAAPLLETEMLIEEVGDDVLVDAMADLLIQFNGGDQQ